MNATPATKIPKIRPVRDLGPRMLGRMLTLVKQLSG